MTKATSFPTEDINAMELAVLQARQCRGSEHDPLVGAVASRGGKLVAQAYRGETNPQDHAEFILLETKLKSQSIAGATVFTTLEPCTTRGSAKVPCADRLIERRVSRVVIGMLDPDQRITGRGILKLRKAGIRVELFPSELAAELEDLNRAFIRDRTALWENFASPQSANFFQWDSAPGLSFKTILSRADRVWVRARSAVNMLSRHNTDIRAFLSRGGEFRIMISDSESPFCRLIYGADEKLFAVNMNAANYHLESLSAFAPNRVKVKLTDKPPSEGMILAEGRNIVENADSIILVQFYPEHTETGGGRPVLAVLPSDQHWFSIFEAEVLRAWGNDE